MTRMVVALALLGLISCTTGKNDRGPSSTDRPSQFVLLSFDGSKNLNMWNNILNFADDMEREGKPVKFTFFVSGTYFVTKENGKIYKPQGQTIYWKRGKAVVKNLGPGNSAIGWADSKAGIVKRIEYMNRAISDGHEIGSHAVGHWSGGYKDRNVDTRWSHATWMNEFKNFNNLIFNWKRNNGIGGPSLLIDASEIKGFRAPQLGVSGGLWTTLRDFKYSYDTSESGHYENWPIFGSTSKAWNIRLGFIPITNTSNKTIAMDYNFYVRHKKQTDKATLKFYENQVYESYMNYFYKNYFGNRAPVVIGHHFSLWNSGIYWRAYKRFAREVCGKKEVECINHKDFAARMTDKSNNTYANYKRGKFRKYKGRKAADPEFLKISSAKVYDLSTKFSAYENGVTLGIDGADKELPFSYKFSINGKAISGKSLHHVGDLMKSQNNDKALLEAKVVHENNEVSVETRAIKLNDDGTVRLAEKSFEDMIQNDHHLAHEGDLNQIMSDYLNNAIE